VVYRIYFHPLSRFPGPKLARLSDLWTVYYSIKGQSHLKAFEAHQKHGTESLYSSERDFWSSNDQNIGSIVRFGPNKLSISSVSAMQGKYLPAPFAPRGASVLNLFTEIYHSKLIQKSQVFETITPAPGAFSTFTAIDKETHRRKRKVFSQAFSDQAIKAFEPTILCLVDIFISQLARAIPHGTVERWTEPLNMTPRARYYATDVMGEFGFGKSFDVQTSDQNRFLLKATDGATVVAGMYCQYPKLKRYGLGRLVALAGMSTKEQFGRLVKELIDQRLSEPNEKKTDLLQFISGNGDRKTEEPFSLNEIWAESRFTLIAGEDQD
jgi:cytochrome P450